jgi:wyosine [tRNA(Phe)-imidazoG37] synthetase (radical SAM superfamily)
MEVRQVLEAHLAGEIDGVTFAGSGEPTLRTRYRLVDQTGKNVNSYCGHRDHQRFPAFDPQMREELAAADTVPPTLDADTLTFYRPINRPHTGATVQGFG